MTTKAERTKIVAEIQLKEGTGTPDTSLCIMQAINYIQRDNLGDHPPCVDPILTEYAIRTNDHILARVEGAEAKAWSDKIKALIPVLIDTAGTKALQKKRAQFIAHHSITVILPLLTDGLELPEISAKLRAFKLSEWKEKEAYCRSIKETLHAAADAAYAAAAAAYAAYAAAAAAYAADAYADAAYAAADAYAYAAADADAYAAYAANADAYAAYAANAAANADAYAAYAAADWLGIRDAVWNARLDVLKKAAAL